MVELTVFVVCVLEGNRVLIRTVIWPPKYLGIWSSSSLFAVPIPIPHTAKAMKGIAKAQLSA